MKRRAALAGLVSSATGLAGCLSSVTGPDEAKITDITIQTTYESAVTLDVKIESKNEVLLDETYEFGPYQRDKQVPYEIIDRAWMDEPGRYTLAIESSTMEDTVERTIPNRGPGCYAVIIRVNRSGRVDVPMDAESSCKHLDQ